MPVTRIFIFLLVLSGGLFFSASASADPHCWTGDEAGYNFGTVTPGQAVSSTAQIGITCNSYDPSTDYIRLCLNFIDENAPVAMNPNGISGYPLYFNVYPSDSPQTALSANSSVFAQFDMAVPSGQSASGSFILTGRILAGQTKLTAMEYYKYNFFAYYKYAFASSRNQLPSCAAMPNTYSQNRISVSATASVKQGCTLDQVSDLDFGQHSPALSPQLSATAISTLSVTCPVNTSFSVALGNGLHSQQSVRQLCNTADNQCVSYQLYQDAAHSVVWNDTNTQTVRSATGNSQNLVVYGVLPAQNWPTAGNYTDTVTVTLRY